MKVWAEMVDPDQELVVRGQRPAFGPMATLRNRRQLLNFVEKEDAEMIEAFQVYTVARVSYPVDPTKSGIGMVMFLTYEVRTSMHATRTGAKCDTAFFLYPTVLRHNRAMPRYLKKVSPSIILGHIN